jgi:CheY-like chemotaxis protein
MTGPAIAAPRQKPGKPRRKSPTDPPPRSLLEGARVLVVEDDPSSRKLLSIVLTDAGANVTAVESAEEALKVLHQARPQLIVLDLILLRMGGLVFAEQVKADPETRSIVIVAVSSLSGPAAERVALSAGCAAYIRKPIDTSEFAHTVARHLGKKQ